MKTDFGSFAVIFGSLAVALWCGPNCAAQCGGVNRVRAAKSSWVSKSEIRLLPLAFQSADEQDFRDGRGASIVGFWHQQLISEGSKGIQDGSVVDDDLAQWHSDNTEIQNTKSRTPSSANFCLGVWEQTGPRKFKLNHFPQAFDPTGTIYVGTAQLQEEITVSSDGTCYSGTFTLDQYDSTGKIVLAHVQGRVTGTRITAKSTIAEVL
jgi:hypothetical protein